VVRQQMEGARIREAARAGIVNTYTRLTHADRRAQPSRQSAPAVVPPATNFDPATWQPGQRQLVWHSPLNGYQSFGLVGRQLLLAAERVGIDVRIAIPHARSAFPEFARFFKPLDGAGRIGFSYEYQPRSSPLPAALTVIYTLSETTFVPGERVDAINRAATLLYVPCRQNLQSFGDSGVRVPIKVFHHGIDPARFPLLARPRTGAEPFTFGCFGDLSPRKGVDVLIRAFGDEFAPHEPVRLWLKSWRFGGQLRIDDPRIELHFGFWSHAQLLMFLQQLDAFVLPSRGEGFGLCGLEAMATGLPTIATNWSGPVEYLDPTDSFPLAYRLVDAVGTESNNRHYTGQWAEPDYEHLRFLLRWIYEHPEEAAQRGQLAAARVHGDWTWERVAWQMRDDFDLLACGVTPW
jgi:glycosyltransferase involved in cell wall biosynthesis